MSKSVEECWKDFESVFSVERVAHVWKNEMFRTKTFRKFSYHRAIHQVAGIPGPFWAKTAQDKNWLIEANCKNLYMGEKAGKSPLFVLLKNLKKCFFQALTKPVLEKNLKFFFKNKKKKIHFFTITFLALKWPKVIFVIWDRLILKIKKILKNF